MNVLCIAVLRSLSVRLQDQAAKEKALQSMATMSSAQIVSPTAFQNKMALQGLSRPAYPTTGGVSLSLSPSHFVNLHLKVGHKIKVRNLGL